MPCLPVNANEIDAFEKRMGFKLPPIYKDRLSDFRIQAALKSKGVEALQAGKTMMDFAELTDEIRAEQPEFPRDGVLMSVGAGVNGSMHYSIGFSRFFLPDTKRPGQLADVVYTWDSIRGRKIRDCSSEEWVDLFISCADEGVLAELGLNKSDFCKKNSAEIRSCSPELIRLLTLRGDDAVIAYQQLRQNWISCADLTYSGKYLCPCDLGQVPEPSASLSVPIFPGPFKAEVQLEPSALGEHLVIGRLRVISGEPDHALSTALGAIDIDLAALALFDRQAFFRKVAVDDREAFALDLLELDTKPCVMMLGRLPILVIGTGDGDGTYPVLSLRNSNGPVGIEIQFK